MTTIYLKQLSEVEQKFIDCKDRTLKNLYYHNQFSGHIFAECYITEDDDFIYYRYKSWKYKRGNNDNMFKCDHKYHGFSYDKQKKKVTYYNIENNQIPYIKEYFKKKNINWFDEELFRYLTKTGLKNILSGRSTNPKDFIKRYLKMNNISAPTGLVYKLIKRGGYDKSSLYMICKNVKNIEGNLNFLLKGNAVDNSFSLIRAASIFNEKVDLRWSKRRMNQEATRLTNKMLKLAAEQIENRKIRYSDNITTLLTAVNKDKYYVITNTRSLHMVTSNSYFLETLLSDVEKGIRVVVVLRKKFFKKAEGFITLGVKDDNLTLLNTNNCYGLSEEEIDVIKKDFNFEKLDYKRKYNMI